MRSVRVFMYSLWGAIGLGGGVATWGHTSAGLTIFLLLMGAVFVLSAVLTFYNPDF